MTLAHDWFDNSDNALIDEPTEPIDANDPMLTIESDEPMLPIDSTEPEESIDRNESWLAMHHLPRGICIGSAYGVATADSLGDDGLARAGPAGNTPDIATKPSIRLTRSAHRRTAG